MAGEPPASDRPAGVDGIRLLTRWLPFALLVGIPAFLVPARLGQGEMVYGQDAVRGFYYVFGMVGDSLASGRIPVWDSHSMCGYPLLAAVQSAVFYPPTWLTILLSPGSFLTTTAFLHLVLTGLFTYQWLRRGLSLGTWSALAGALVAMLAGSTLLKIQAGHVTSLNAFPWLAAILWRAERLLHRPTLKRWVLLSGCVAMPVLGGYPQFLMVIGLAGAARLGVHIFHRREGRGVRMREAGIAVGALALGLLLAAPQLLPTLEFLPYTQRVDVDQYQFSTRQSVPPENLVMLVAPGFLGNSIDVPYWGRWAIWETCAFVGIVSLPIAVLGLGRRHPLRFLWAALAVFAILLALGRYTPFFRGFYAVMPGIDLFRAPGRFLSLFTLAMAALVGLGFERLWRNEGDTARPCLRAAIGMAALFACIVAGLIVMHEDQGGASPAWKDVLRSAQHPGESALESAFLANPGFHQSSYDTAWGSLMTAAIVVALVAGILAGHGLNLFGAKAAAWALAIVLAGEMTVFGAGHIHGKSVEGIEWPDEFVSYVRSRPGGPHRIVSPGVEQVASIGRCRLSGLDHVGGYDSLVLACYAQIMNVMHGLPKDDLVVISSPMRPHPILDAMGGKLWLVPRRIPPPPGWPFLARIADLQMYENVSALPRAFVVPDAVVLESPDERLAYLADLSFNPRQVVVLEHPGQSGRPAGEGPRGTVRVVSHSPGEYELEAESRGGEYLVLSEAHFPGWEAEINGKPAEVLRANHFMQAARLPAGRSRVRFTYTSRYLNLGFVLASVAGIAVGALFVWTRRRKPASAR